MLDESLPTFLFRPMPDTPHSHVVYFTRQGLDPTPEYVLRLADPSSQPACRGVYAAALADPYNPDTVVYAEVDVQPVWQQPPMTPAEMNRVNAAGEEIAAAPIPKVPDVFRLQLYNPDQTVTVKYTPSSWNKTESWEFSMPVASFKQPSASQLDAEEAASAAASSMSIGPQNTFRWRRDGRGRGRLGTKDMTCYLVGKSTNLSSTSSSSSSSSSKKEPDITVALFKHARDPLLTMYEPNLQRVDVQDRKGLDLVLLLGAQVIRDLWVTPRADPFHLDGAAPRKNTRRSSGQASTGGVAVVAATAPAAPAAPPPINTAVPPTSSSSPPLHVHDAPPPPTPSAAAIDAETKRLQAMLEREERDRRRRERDEEKRIQRMLEDEDKERRRREAAVAKETERLRKKYGLEGQNFPGDERLPSSSAGRHRNGNGGTPPSPPPRPSQQQQQQQHHHHHHHNDDFYMSSAVPDMPPRPVSVGPSSGSGSGSGFGSGSGSGGRSSHHWWNNNNNSSNSNSNSNGNGSSGRTRHGSGPFLNPLASTSQFFTSSESERRRVQKKRSVHF